MRSFDWLLCEWFWQEPWGWWNNMCKENTTPLSFFSILVIISQRIRGMGVVIVFIHFCAFFLGNIIAGFERKKLLSFSYLLAMVLLLPASTLKEVSFMPQLNSKNLWLSVRNGKPDRHEMISVQLYTHMKKLRKQGNWQGREIRAVAIHCCYMYSLALLLISMLTDSDTCL